MNSQPFNIYSIAQSYLLNMNIIDCKSRRRIMQIRAIKFDNDHAIHFHPIFISWRVSVLPNLLMLVFCNWLLWIAQSVYLFDFDMVLWATTIPRALLLNTEGCYSPATQNIRNKYLRHHTKCYIVSYSPIIHLIETGFVISVCSLEDWAQYVAVRRVQKFMQMEKLVRFKVILSTEYSIDDKTL